VTPGRYADADWFNRSDHYHFDRIGVPSVLYVGTTDDYHTADDNLERLQPEVNRAVANHAFRLITTLADGAPAGTGVRLPGPRDRIDDFQVIDAPGPTPLIAPFRGKSQPL
jgi:hypothetical protein